MSGTLRKALRHLETAESLLSTVRDDDQGYWDRMCATLRSVIADVGYELDHSR